MGEKEWASLCCRHALRTYRTFPDKAHSLLPCSTTALPLYARAYNRLIEGPIAVLKDENKKIVCVNLTVRLYHPSGST